MNLIEKELAKDKAREEKIKTLMAGWTAYEGNVICPFCGCRERTPKVNGDGYYRCKNFKKLKGAYVCNRTFRLFDGGKYYV